MPLDPELPRWATNVGRTVVPPSGKQDVGWVAAEKPAARFLNWCLNRSYQWLLSLSSTLTGLATWDGFVSSTSWFVTGGPGVTFSFHLSSLTSVKTSNASMGVPAPFNIAGIPTIEGGATYLEPNEVYYVYSYWDTVGGTIKYESSVTAPVGAVKSLDPTRRYLFPFYTNRRTVSGTDYGLPIPFIRQGSETRYLLNADTSDGGLLVFDDTIDETDPEVNIGLDPMLPIDALYVLVRFRAYVSVASSGGTVHLYETGGTVSEFNAFGFLSANDQYNFFETWVPLLPDRVLNIKLNRTRAANPMTTELKVWVVGFRSPAP